MPHATGAGVGVSRGAFPPEPALPEAFYIDGPIKNLDMALDGVRCQVTFFAERDAAGWRVTSASSYPVGWCAR